MKLNTYSAILTLGLLGAIQPILGSLNLPEDEINFLKAFGFPNNRLNDYLQGGADEEYEIARAFFLQAKSQGSTPSLRKNPNGSVTVVTTLHRPKATNQTTQKDNEPADK